jgi:hypothetical protein
LIGLCSDAMAEGINLPDARALVLLDMPSVLRIIEQRIGRLERMDSEHDEIHVLWPDDSDEFSLKGDRRIIDIVLKTESLIGGNVEIPTDLYDRHLKDINNITEHIKRYEEYEKNDEEWQGVKDNTQSLYSLIDGPEALISAETYKELADVDATVKTAISFIETDRHFSFFAFRGAAARSPKWLFIDERNKTYTDFGEITNKLKQYLGGQSIVNRSWNQVNPDKEIKTILYKLRSIERSLLPPKKRRALEIGQKCLINLEANPKTTENLRRLARKLLGLFNSETESDDWIDYNHLAELWLSILLPALDKKRSEKIRNKWMLTLSDLKEKDVNLSESQLLEMLDNCQYASTLDELIASCIISIPKSQASI